MKIVHPKLMLLIVNLVVALHVWLFIINMFRRICIFRLPSLSLLRTLPNAFSCEVNTVYRQSFPIDFRSRNDPKSSSRALIIQHTCRGSLSALLKPNFAKKIVFAAFSRSRRFGNVSNLFTGSDSTIDLFFES